MYRQPLGDITNVTQKKESTQLTKFPEQKQYGPVQSDIFKQSNIIQQYETFEETEEEDEEEDPKILLACSNGIVSQLLQKEQDYCASPNYMDQHFGLNWAHRRIMMSWIIQIHKRKSLRPETLYLAANILDRFLSIYRKLDISQLQLVGIVSLFIAQKYEERHASVEDYLMILGGLWTRDKFLGAERIILNALDFQLCYPHPQIFLTRMCRASSFDHECFSVACFLMEISLVDHRLLSTAPSRLAASAMWLARKICKKGTWDENFVHFSNYTETDIYTHAQIMLDYLRHNRDGNDVLYKKYDTEEYDYASDICKIWASSIHTDTDN